MRGLIGAIVTFFILLFVFSKWGPSIPFSVISQQNIQPMIVEGTGKVFVTPDIAKVSVGIEESGASLKSVQDSVSKKSKSLTDALKKFGIDEKDIKTTSYNLYPQFDYSTPSQRLIGYRVSTNYLVTIKDFDKVNEVLAGVTDSGANIVGGVSFEVNDETKKEKLQEAREVAVKEAKEKAQGLAKAAGVTLGKITNISESQGIEPRPIALMEKAIDLDASEPAAPDIEPGETELSINVVLAFEIR
jgi:hypothetical protein